MDRRVGLGLVLGAHLVAAVAHGLTHGVVPVWLSAWQNGLVLLTTFVGPVAGFALVRRGHRLGVPAFTLAMASALGLGLVLHGVVESPDHLAAIPPGPYQLPFRATAASLAAIDGVGTAVGGWIWRAPASGRTRAEDPAD